jgi:hypothetical protein
MILDSLCPPAVIYILFSLTQIVIDTIQGYYNKAFIKVWVATIMTIVLNYLCNVGLNIISWIFVFVPFILMTTITTILLVTFGLHPHRLGINIPDNSPPPSPSISKPIDHRKLLIHKKDNENNKNEDKILDDNKHRTKPVFFDNYNDSNVNTML